MATFKERMFELRIEKGLKKTDVAAGTGLDRSTITKYESGERDNPTREILKRIAEYFGVSMDYLSGNSDIRDRDVSSKTLSEIFGMLSDEGKIQLVKYAKYLQKEQEDGEHISD
jgi:transcriptional regulator with XRE-family HTH domain